MNVYFSEEKNIIFIIALRFRNARNIIMKYMRFVADYKYFGP